MKRKRSVYHVKSCYYDHNGNGDVMKGELYPEIAPNTVNNFISLANKHFYDGKIFHRVIPGFMIQGGCRREPVWVVPDTPSKENLHRMVLPMI